MNQIATQQQWFERVHIQRSGQNDTDSSPKIMDFHHQTKIQMPKTRKDGKSLTVSAK